ncbi:DUF2147 domain-containing protein [Abyssalbus ytuae]|uniref:DUF2147 domain-containing protein n=1 Tax=Abyssalbus ytuae TaxID=2926907 RepID=A0A9E6ZZP8_9FLAO|nr:DUF2147 domain-containing protein [Abyssalbus ytuae]UOB18127.1 DUF2147 domain-containing protein [Abyssalbus ytuae]
MITSFYSTIVLMLSFSTPVQHTEDAIIGVWTNETHNSHLEIFQKGDKYYGKIIWLKEPLTPEGKAKTDVKNPDPSLRSQPIVGLVILKNVAYKKGKWVGEIYAPRKGTTVSCSLLLSPDNNELTLKAKKFGFTTTKKWSRIQ